MLSILCSRIQDYMLSLMNEVNPCLLLPLCVLYEMQIDGTDFGFWRMQIEDYLYGKKLHLLLLGEKPATMKDEEWTLLDRQVLGVIKLTLSWSVAHNVLKEKSTVDLMKALCGMYEKPLANNKVHLMKKLFNLKMAENASIA